MKPHGVKLDATSTCRTLRTTTKMLSVCEIPSHSKMAGCRQCHRAGHIGPESNWLFLQMEKRWLPAVIDARIGSRHRHVHLLPLRNRDKCREPHTHGEVIASEFANYSRAFTRRFKPKASGLNRRSAYSRSCARFSGCRSRKICPAISYSSRSRVSGVPHSLFRRYKCRYK